MERSRNGSNTHEQCVFHVSQYLFLCKFVRALFYWHQSKKRRKFLNREFKLERVDKCVCARCCYSFFMTRKPVFYFKRVASIATFHTLKRQSAAAKKETHEERWVCVRIDREKWSSHDNMKLVTIKGLSENNPLIRRKTNLYESFKIIFIN